MGYATPIDISDEDMLYSVLTRPIPPKTEYAKQQRPATPTELSTSSDDISSDNESTCAYKLRPVTPVLTETSTSDVYSSDTDTELASERTPEADPAELEPAECAVAPRTWRQAIEPRLSSVATLVGIFACAPFVVACWVVLVALGRTFGERLAAIGGKRCDEVEPNGVTAIVSGGKMTKAYVIARQLKAQGCRVVLLETSKYWMVASRASNCVDRFAMVPLPEKDLAGYLDAVRALAIEEKADLFIPVTSPAASEYEAQVAPVLPAGCVSWSLDLETVRDLDDKTAFCSSAERLGLPVPRSHRVASDKEAHAFNEKLLAEAVAAMAGAETRYILKSLAYDSMHRLDLFTLPCAPDVLDAYLAKLHTDGAAITQENPWIIQTFVVGDEYSTCALVKEGRLLAFTDNRACLSCFNYTPARSEALRSWVCDFCAARRLSGVVCIDFIVDAQSGTPYAIECNPRFSSNVLNLLSNPAFGAALIRPDEVVDAVEPLAAQGETYFLFAEVWALLSKRPFSLRSAGALLSTVATKKDAYFDVADPLPFIAHLFVHIPALLARNLSTGNKWAKIDPCIGKLTEENGD